MSKNITVSLTPLKIRISPLGFHMYSSDFLRAAISLERTDAPFSPVQYYLVTRAVELGLKAFLCAKGVSLKELSRRPYRHDLEGLLEEAERRDISSGRP